MVVSGIDINETIGWTQKLIERLEKASEASVSRTPVGSHLNKVTMLAKRGFGGCIDNGQFDGSPD